jgi:hypothetical protein
MLKIVTIVAFSFCLSLDTALSFSGNGSGTEDDPYQITNVYELQEMNDELDAHYILMNDIDASETREWNVGDHDGNPETPDSAMGFEPVGELNIDDINDYFTGKFDGRDYSIKDIYINRPFVRNIGLFGCIADGGRILKCKIMDSEITGYENVGVLAGVIFIETDTRYSKIKILDCHCSGRVYGENNIGGFCGIINTSFASTTIERCYSNVSVYGNMNVGGFYGRSYIYDCRVDINECFSGGSVRATGDNVGGFYGINNSDKSQLIINKCCSIGYVSGNDYVGGFCGKNIIANPNENQIDSISDCFSTCSVSGNDYVGGFCGYEQINTKDDKVRINRCYSNGRVNGKKEGGFCAYQNNNYEEDSYNYWDSEASMVSESFIAVGKSTNEMKTKTTFEAWDFTNIWDIDPYKNFGFPHLRDVPWGIMDEPILISIRDNHILNEIQPNFKWFHVYPAIEYIFQISKTPNFDIILIDTVLNDIEYKCKYPLEYDNKYYWRVKAQGSYESSYWSKVWSFEIKDFCMPGNSFSGKGKGTKESPFEISNICQLQEMKNDLDAYYKLVNDINGSDTKYWNFGDHDGYPYWFSPDSAMGFEPVGTYEEDNLNAGFTGTFDGQGFTISDLFINRPIGNCIGLFGCISDESKINNVVIDHADYTGKISVGVLVGYVLSSNEDALIIIKDCSVKGKIGGCYDLGGMIGDILSFYESVLINNCTSAVDIHRSYRYYDNNPWFYGIGGLIGSCVSWGDTIIIKKSHSTGSIFSSSNNNLVNVGGFCGRTSSNGRSMVKIFDCYSTGSIFSENNDQWNVGGFCGENGARNWDHSSAIIENCYSTGDIILVNEEERNTTESVGGFCGTNVSYGECVAIINNCYSTGNIFVKNEICQ